MKYKISYRINEYLINRNYEMLIGDNDHRIITAANEDDAVSKLRNMLNIKDTASKMYEIEILDIEER